MFANEKAPLYKSKIDQEKKHDTEESGFLGHDTEYEIIGFHWDDAMRMEDIPDTISE
jgi:hypothetical protein